MSAIQWGRVEYGCGCFSVSFVQKVLEGIDAEVEEGDYFAVVPFYLTALGVRPQGSGAFCAVTDRVAAVVSPVIRSSFLNFMIDLLNK